MLEGTIVDSCSILSTGIVFFVYFCLGECLDLWHAILCVFDGYEVSMS